MLTSISPLGERARRNRWPVTVTAYVLGSLLGGATTGVVLGAAGSALPRPLLLAALVCAAAAVLDALHRVPSYHRQVDEDWLVRYRGWVYGLGFGYQLGLGFVTIVTSAATYAVWLLELLSGGWRQGLLIGASFGLLRALPVLGLRTATTPERLRVTAARLERLASPAGGLTVATLAAAGLALGVAA
jgi:hypothetical protein